MERKNPYPPGSSYTANGFSYRLDDLGRIVEAEGELRLAGTERTRDPAAQREAGHADRLPDDDGGHLIGTRFGGSPGLENLIPQNRVFNRADYKIMENEWAHQLELGNRVTVHLEPVYPETGERPLYLVGEYTIQRPDGTGISETFSFTNLDARSLEREMDLLPDEDLSDLPVEDPGLTPEQRELANEVEKELDSLTPKQRHELFDNAVFVEVSSKKEDGASPEPEPEAPGRAEPPPADPVSHGEKPMKITDWIKSHLKGDGTPETTEPREERTFQGLEVDKDGYVLSPEGAASRAENDRLNEIGAVRYQSIAPDTQPVEKFSANRIEGVRLNPEEVQDPDRFWSQHTVYDADLGRSRPATREDFLELASHIPEVQNRLDAGESLSDLEKDPRIGACATQYFDPQVMPRAITGRGCGSTPRKCRTRTGSGPSTPCTTPTWAAAAPPHGRIFWNWPPISPRCRTVWTPGKACPTWKRTPGSGPAPPSILTRRSCPGPLRGTALPKCRAEAATAFWRPWSWAMTFPCGWWAGIYPLSRWRSPRSPRTRTPARKRPPIPLRIT